MVTIKEARDAEDFARRQRESLMSWFDRGYDDAINGRESRPAQNAISRDDYTRGFQAGKIKASKR